MVITEMLLLGSILSITLNILYVAVGLGLVIFFHELGHFAVAKWCDVHVERFSIGFGPILFSWTWGETEYAFSAIPFGGYVKMLGQDDMDPSQLTSEEIAEDPRAYSAKSVPKRMAIISAGVIMNVLTAVLFYASAFGMGVKTPPPTIGTATVGKPAWTAGLRTGDTITSINGRKVEAFMDIARLVALSTGDLVVEGKHANGEPFKITITPDGSGTRRRIGVAPTVGTTLVTPREGEDIRVTMPGTAAHEADPGFEAGDTIVRIGKTQIPDYATLKRVLAERRDQTLTFYVRRAGAAEDDLTEITVKRNPFRLLGLSLEIGEISAVRRGSPGEQAGLKRGDKISVINKKKLGTELNPIELPDLFEKWAKEGKDVTMSVVRKGVRDPVTVTVKFSKGEKVIPAWSGRPSAPDIPLPVSSLGIAFHMVPTVIAVVPDSPADKAGIKPQTRLRKMVLSLPEGTTDGANKNKPVTIEFGEDKNGRLQHNWAYAFWMMQLLPSRTVTLTVVQDNKDRELTIKPEPSKTMSLPLRGIQPELKLIELQESNPLAALEMGLKRSRDTIFDVYLTIARLVSGGLSYKELSGPVRIAKVAYKVAEQGIPDFLIFLGFLSINLAVLNFLPIPVLDGGHMVFLIWEAVTRKRPSEKVMIGAQVVGLAIVLGLMGLVLWLDLFVH